MKSHGCVAAAAAVLSVFVLLSCTGKDSAKSGNMENKNRIAVFVPGVVSGNPVYEMLAAGVQLAAQEATKEGKKVSVTVIEAGAAQADWENKLTALAASGDYDLVITSNPAMPDIIAPVSAEFPKLDFIVFDAWAQGNPRVTSFRYNQREQAYISGYIAALVSSSEMKFANREKKIGVIAGQEYPAMLNVILPAYLEGACAVDPGFTVEFRVVGNWYDATKGAELARSLKNSGVDVIMPISGGANQGVIAAAKDSGFYLAWFDDNGFEKAPGYVVSSAVMAQERLAREATKSWLDGTLVKGVPKTVGIAEGYIDFADGDPRYIETVPADIRERQSALMKRLRSGDLVLPVQ